VRFTTSDKLIDLLVGQNLYTSPDVALRELLQNAEDACHLQSIVDSTFAPEIVVRYSIASNWVEIVDNGLGMDHDVFEQSFATIGASKSNIPKLEALLSQASSSHRPIGQFGIGVLSCFGVAEVIEVRSLADDSTPVSFRIRDRHTDFEALGDHRSQRGTSIRLMLRPDGPMHSSAAPNAVSRHVRHAKHIWLEDVDNSTKIIAPEQWLNPELEKEQNLPIPAADIGRMQLSEAWENINSQLSKELILCNAGFLVTTDARDILPEFATGIRGEISAKPGALAILMNREGFQQDEKWTAFKQDVLESYKTIVGAKLDAWLAVDLKKMPRDFLRAVQRMMFLVLKTPLKDVIGPENIARAKQLIPSALLLADQEPPDFNKVVEAAKQKPPLYIYNTDGNSRLQRQFTDHGQNVSVTEAVRSMDLRIYLLKMNGYAVVSAE
jgi:hypothetical protein